MSLTIDDIQDTIYRIEKELGWKVSGVRISIDDIKHMEDQLDLIWDNDSRRDTICGVDLVIDHGLEAGKPMFYSGSFDGFDGYMRQFVKSDNEDDGWLGRVLKDIGD